MTGLLTIGGLEAGYGGSRVLFGVELAVGEGEVVTLLGRNGMGKTTTVRAIMGLARPTAGHVLWRGRDVAGRPPHYIARLGLGLVPEGRQIFPNLTVRENLLATARPPAADSDLAAWTRARVEALFPRLAERADHWGDQLSGGEQQMLAIGRALMTNPRLLILDEATEGLAPLIRREIWQALAAVRDSGLAILLIDKNLKDLLPLADRHVVLEKGRTVWTGSSAMLATRPDVTERYLGV